jgi:hypothetical protein
MAHGFRARRKETDGHDMARSNEPEHEHVVTVADETLSIGSKTIAMAAGAAGFGAVLGGPIGAVGGALLGGTIGATSGIIADIRSHKA